MAAAKFLRHVWHVLLALFAVPVVLACVAVALFFASWAYCVVMAVASGRVDREVVAR